MRVIKEGAEGTVDVVGPRCRSEVRSLWFCPGYDSKKHRTEWSFIEYSIYMNLAFYIQDFKDYMSLNKKDIFFLNFDSF